MIKFRCHKLVRDKTVQRLTTQGIQANHHIITGQDLCHALQNKLIEEAREVKEAQNRQEVIDELADVLEVIDSLYQAYDIKPDEINKVKEHKINTRGGFHDGLFLESIVMEESNPRTPYYRALPNRYPEEKE